MSERGGSCQTERPVEGVSSLWVYEPLVSFQLLQELIVLDGTGSREGEVL